MGGRKYPKNDPQKGCAMIAQCAGVGEFHFLIVFLRLTFLYTKETFEGVLGQKFERMIFLLFWSPLPIPLIGITKIF